jgi:hypothetical protein
VTVQNALAPVVLAAIVAGAVLLIRSGWPGLRMLGWALVVVMVLFGGLMVLTQGSPSGINPDLFYPPQDKFPDGGLELAVRRPPSVTS